MDFLTTIVVTAAVVAVLARVVEVAVRRPDVLSGLLQGARPFAEAALAESEELRRGRLALVERSAEAEIEERPALAA